MVDRSLKQDENNNRPQLGNPMPTDMHGQTHKVTQVNTLAEGASRVVPCNDGDAEVPALLLTKDMMSLINKVGRCVADISVWQQKLDRVSAKISRSKEQREAGDSPISCILGDAAWDPETRQEALKLEHSQVELELACSRSHLNTATLGLQSILETATRSAGLLDVWESPDKSHGWDRSPHRETGNAQETKSIDNNRTARSSKSQDVAKNGSGEAPDDLRPQEVNRIEDSHSEDPQAMDAFAILKDLADNVAYYHNVNHLWQSKEVDYEVNLRQWREGRANGEYSIGRTDFDLEHVVLHSQHTRALIEASEALHASREYAKEVGALRPGADDYDPFDPSLGWYEEDDYELSDVPERASMLEPDQIDRIQRWREAIDLDETLTDSPETSETDDWDAISVGISESESMVAPALKKRKIDDWNDSCLQRWRETVDQNEDLLVAEPSGGDDDSDAGITEIGARVAPPSKKRKMNV